jgi:CheY-like chemotaxis protein
VTVSLPAGTWSIPKAKSTDDTGGMEKLEILVVDDLEPVVRQLDKAFTRLGHHVKTALSGPDALELFKENPVDVIICDLGMPDMNGWQVGKAVRESCAETGRPQPIFLILTGWGGQVEETEKITESAVDGVIEKPADIRQIIEIVKEARLKRGH